MLYHIQCAGGGGAGVEPDGGNAAGAHKSRRRCGSVEHPVGAALHHPLSLLRQPQGECPALLFVNIGSLFSLCLYTTAP